ncbi:hypothetical protein HGI47_00470 [Novosphingobium sp. ERN07]|uniref:hypothetical protein n=1 Tax=Novosphingobium sp. ERN07 TaxID=2726187 RepID=UPI001456C064|nr:hypothetical protein [Novosphingobium sp. ERN07]NLR69346.1 hypothetical protein [Novosphingobium sp. ERN07]
MNHPTLPLTATLALSIMATQLGGCAAAALVPLMAGGTLTGKEIIENGKRGDSEGPAKPVVIVGKGVSTVPPAINTTPTQPIASAPGSAEALAPPAASETAPLRVAEAATAAPFPPSATDVESISPAAAPDDDGYAAMTAFVLAAAKDVKPAPGRKSALLDQRTLASLPSTRPCGEQRGALLIDLDPGDKAFDLDDPPSPAPGLADRLRAIRGTGTAVVWIASLPETAEKPIGTILKATGLDPLGIDPVLLLRRTETRKQQILQRADSDWCVLAIAGDRKADFDEVFDYLRNPNGPVAVALDANIGDGWFLVPPPVK